MSVCHTSNNSGDIEMLDLEKLDDMDNSTKEQMLVQATLDGNLKAMQVLVRMGASVDAEDYNRYLFYYTCERNLTPLMIAANRGNVQCLHFLINSGADVNAKDRFEVTATHIAADQGHYDCLKALLHAGAECSIPTKYSKRTYPYYRGTTPLHLAAMNNNAECIKELIQFGADHNAIDSRGFTALYIAAEEGYDECVQALLKNAVGHKILSLPGFETGDTPLHFAVRRGMIDTVKHLLHLGSDVNHLNNAGYSPLHICVSSSSCDPDVSFKILKLLVFYGYNIDVNLPDGDMLTPLHYVAFNAATLLTRQPEMATFLIAYGADIDIFNHLGINLMQTEYSSDYPDTSVLEACVNRLNFLPIPRDLMKHNYVVENVPPHLMRAFCTIFVAVYEGLEPFEIENMHRNDRQIMDNIDLNTIKHIWYRNKTTKPRSLLHLCRHTIRSSVGYRNLRNIKNLPLPTPIKSYLLFGAEMPTD